ncbi:MAG: hypothetical protein ABSH07_11895 [Candidatus Dormibacteria bacterium]
MAVTVTWTVTVELLAADPDVVDRTRGRGPMAADFQATMGLTQRASLARLGAATGVYEIPLHSQVGWGDLPDDALEVKGTRWDLESVAVDGQEVPDG